LDTAQLARAVQADGKRAVIIIDRSFDPPRRFNADAGGKPIFAREAAQ